MNIRWKRFILQSVLWLTAEVFLTSIGMDDLADYSEYHFSSKESAIAQLICTVPLV